MDRSFLESIKAMQEEMGANSVGRIMSIPNGCGHVSHVLVMGLQNSSVPNISSHTLLLQDIHHRIECSKVLSVGWLIFSRPSAMPSAVVASLVHLADTHLFFPPRRSRGYNMSDDPWASDGGPFPPQNTSDLISPSRECF
jgi:hypothetical protein